MNFQPGLAAKVMAGEKTVTRRLCSTNPRSPWFVGGCSFKVGRDYAVCPGRGKVQLGRVRVVSVTREHLQRFGDDEARREGFATFDEFLAAVRAINDGPIDPLGAPVWRIEFSLC